jgi:methionyl-tRNA synthetase
MSTSYITTPIYYVNDRPHIGHCYTTTLADVTARFERLAGRETWFLTGTDEHADKVIAKAREHGVSEQQWVDSCAAQFKDAFALLGIGYDVFYRTSDEHHKALAQLYIAELMAKGDVYLGDYVGWYDASQDEYLTETVAKDAGYKSPVTGVALEKRTEKNYFFRLSKYQAALEAHLAANPGFVLPAERRNEVLGRLRSGLLDVPVSRALKPGESAWGVLMPGDSAHRVYVWIEALCNYLTAVDRPELARFWPATTHLMAKDILWFHAVIWPAMLMALGRPLPGAVYAHAYWVRDGKKMSKSLGNFVDLDVIRAYVGRFGADALRYYLVTQGPGGSTDSDFNHAKFVETFNAELANGIGNATSRVGNMIDKYFAGPGGGVVPAPTGPRLEAGTPGAETGWPALVASIVGPARGSLDRRDVAAATLAGIAIVRQVDSYINTTEPFKLAKRVEAEPALKQRLGTILYHCAEALRIASILLSPAMPTKMAQLWTTWSCTPSPGATLGELCLFGGPHALKPGTGLTKGEVLFMRADPAEPAPA